VEESRSTEFQTLNKSQQPIIQIPNKKKRKTEMGKNIEYRITNNEYRSGRKPEHGIPNPKQIPTTNNSNSKQEKTKNRNGKEYRISNNE
jgi:hypothetical protein